MSKYKIWAQPHLESDGYANATGSTWGIGNGINSVWDSRSQARVRVVHGSGSVMSENGKVVIAHGTASDTDCSSLMSHYQTLHGHSVNESDASKRGAIQAQMRTILNQMHHIGCGQYSGFTGEASEGANALTNGEKTDVYGNAAGIAAQTGPYYTWCSGAFTQPQAANNPFSGTTCMWNNPLVKVDALSAANMVMTNPVGDLSSLPSVNNNVPSCTTTVCTPSPVADGKTVTTTSCVPAAGITDASTAAPAPMPYVKPTFWEWLKNGMKA